MRITSNFFAASGSGSIVKCLRSDAGHETGPQVDDRDDGAAKVDDAGNVFRRLRQGNDLGLADDFPHIVDGDPVGLAVEFESEVLAGLRLNGGCLI